MQYFSFQVTLTYVEAANVKNDHSDLRVDGLVLLVDQRAVIHLAVTSTELHISFITVIFL